MGRKKKEAPLKDPTDDFLTAISAGHGALRGTCDFCERVYFASTGDYDSGELEELQAKAKEFPDRYIETGDEWQSMCRIAGKEYVYGCPCNAPTRYEDFIWAHRWQIAKYLKLRSKGLLEDQIREYRHIKEIPKELPDGPGRPLCKPRRIGSPRRVESSPP